MKSAGARRARFCLYPLLLSLLLAYALSSCAPDGGIRVDVAPVAQAHVELEALSEEYSASDSLQIRFTLTNTGDSPIYFLAWDTPLSGIYADVFLVEKSGELVDYIGPLAYRRSPLAEDFERLESGSSVSGELDLSEYYALELSGTYEVTYKSEKLNIGVESPSILVTTMAVQGIEGLAVYTEPISLTLSENRMESSLPMVAPDSFACSEERKNTIYGVIAEAEAQALYAHEALSHLHVDERGHCERYDAWFGEYNAERYRAVIENLNSIHSALAHVELSFDCRPPECDEGVVAYVYSQEPYVIHLCALFWDMPLMGHESQAGVVVHEISHFEEIAGTEDNAYCWTESLCQNLDIDEALQNADSYRVFVENVPPLQPVGPVQGSIFCRERQRCCEFPDQFVCSLCITTSISCEDVECTPGEARVEACDVRVGAEVREGVRERRCIAGAWQVSPCSPMAP